MKIVKRRIFEGDRSPIGLNQLGIQPRSKIRGISNRRRKGDDLGVGLDVPQSSQIDFKRWSSGTVVHEVELIGNHATHVGDQFGAMTQQRIELFRGAHQDVAIVNVLGLGRGIADAQTNRPAHARRNFRQVLVFLHRQGFERHDVDGF